MNIQLPVIAGGVSTVIFAASTLPMLVKAGRTKNLSSYSLGNIVLSNVGNAVHSIYVFHLPAGPIWVLHSFYVTTTALMLVWYFRYAIRRSSRAGQGEVGSAEPRRDEAARPIPQPDVRPVVAAAPRRGRGNGFGPDRERYGATGQLASAARLAHAVRLQHRRAARLGSPRTTLP